MDVPDDPANKAAWRVRARAARAALDRTTWSRALCSALRDWPPYRHASTVGLYLAFGSEADLAELLADDKRFTAPRIARRGRRMHFHDANGPYERHRYGMLEPHRSTPVVPAHDIDLILVPGLAFDRTGARLGNGGGYYDAWLSDAWLSEAWSNDASSNDVGSRRPIVGVCHPELQVDRLPSERHDVSMSHLLLPDGVVACLQR